MGKKLLVLLVVSLCLTGTASAWDLAADFEANYDAVANPGLAGIWSEGLYVDNVGGTFQLYDAQWYDGYMEAKGWVMAPGPEWYMGEVGQHVADNYFDNPTWWPDVGMSFRPWQCFTFTPDPTVLPTAGNGFRFTAPADGEYAVAIEFENRGSAPGENPDQLPTGVYVTLNDVVVHDETVTGFTFSDPALPQSLSNYNATLQLLEGDTITFGGYNLDGQAGFHCVGIDAVIIPEPATMLLLGLGGLVLRRRR